MPLCPSCLTRHPTGPHPREFFKPEILASKFDGRADGYREVAKDTTHSGDIRDSARVVGRSYRLAAKELRKGELGRAKAVLDDLLLYVPLTEMNYRLIESDRKDLEVK